MKRKKRDLFRELSAGIRAMRDHAEGRIEQLTTRVSPSRLLMEADTRTAARDSRRRRKRASFR